MIGFSIPGRVLEGPNGRPLFKAKVILNGKPAGTTKEDGTFVLEKIKAGNHKIYIEAGIKITHIHCCGERYLHTAHDE